MDLNNVYTRKLNFKVKIKRIAHLHQFCPDRLDVVIEEVRLEVVHTQLQGTKTLADQGLRAIEGTHQWIHEHR